MSKEQRNKVTKQPSSVKIVNSSTSSGGSSGSGSRNVVSPVLQEVGKLAAGVAAVATGSATGNPRNKHALQPGHSLMDWIRLGSSGKDLTGVGSRAGELSVTLRQLALHNKENDAWIAIRGRVYNVTHYLPFHPGGPEELMKGIGKDATSLFDQVHSWVNYESILQKCHIGRLVAIDPDIDTAELFYGKKSPNNSTVNSPRVSAPKLLPPNKITPLDEPNHTNIIQDIPFKEPSPLKSITLPRFDWIQKTDFITIIFYTRSLSNPQIEIKAPNVDNVVVIQIEYDNQIFTNDIQFFKEIQWPCQIKINYETGKIEVQFRKSSSSIWENYGTLRQKSEETLVTSEFKYKYNVVNKVEVNYNTSLLELQRSDASKLVVPLGTHIQVYANVQSEEVSRSYTPVPNCLFVKFKPQTYLTDNICLLVKSYQQGCVSKYICGKKKGEVVEITKPTGNLSLECINNRETFLLLAAGTGITPMLSLILFLLERRMKKCQNMTLLFFNRSEEDILIRAQLEGLEAEDSRFKVRHVLSQPALKWQGLRGQISKTVLTGSIEEHLHGRVYKQSDIFTFVCGPTPFTNLANSLLADLGFRKEQIHLFVG